MLAEDVDVKSTGEKMRDYGRDTYTVRKMYESIPCRVSCMRYILCRISCVLSRSAPSESPSAYCEMYRATSRCSYSCVGLLFSQAKHSNNRTSSPIV